MLLNFYLLSAIIILLFLPGYIMPCVTLWERWASIKSKRSLLDKSAYQINLLSFSLQALFFCLLLVDFVFQGSIYDIFKNDALQLFPILLLNSAVSAVITLINLFPKKAVKLTINLISCFFSIGSLLLSILLIIFSQNYIAANGFSHPELLQEIPSHFIHYDKATLAFFLIVLFIFLLHSAYVHCVCWHIFVKNKYDYGRDFYNYVISLRSKQAFLSGVLFVAISLIALFSLSLYTNVWGKWGMIKSPIEYLYFSGYILYPLSLFFLQRVAKSSLPLQKKSLAFFSLILIYISIISLIAQQCLI